jgi:hypothetical protein
MKVTKIEPPREYQCGFEFKRTIRDCARVELEPNEQVTFVTDCGAEYDVTRKDFGFYATPSTNGRLARFGLRTALAQNRLGQVYVLLLACGKEAEFRRYLSEEKMTIVSWLDSDDAIKRLRTSVDCELT